ncbi:MAG: GNAT family N-acetyltransferase [Actinomycetota bacterium]
MELRPASVDDIGDLATLVVGDPTQASTVAAMRLFALDGVEDALELNRVMIASTESWRSTTVADLDGAVGGMVQVGEASMAFTPDMIDLAHRLYGPDFQSVLGPRLAAQARVQASYPSGCLRVSEIHVRPEHRGAGVGSALMNHIAGSASNDGFTSLGLQTLTTNPARERFEAWGFHVIATTTDPEFESLTGASGYHTMQRELDG